MAAISNNFVATLQKSPHEFLQPSLPLYTDAIAYLKNFLDPLAHVVSAEQQQRLKESRKKRKRGQSSGDQDFLRLTQLHTDGFGVEQVWEQARRVIDAAREEAEREYELARPQSPEESEDGQSESKTVRFADETEDDGQSVDSEDTGVEGVDYEIEGPDDGEEEWSDEGADEDGNGEADEDALEGALNGEDTDMHDDFDEMNEDEDAEEQAAELVTDKFGLNDGFFSIDDFNKQSEFLEQQDARGDDDGAASDEEDVDWDADPLGKGAGAALKEVDAAADSEDEEGGPTFGDPDALSEDEDEDLDGGDLDGIGGMGNTNDVMYKDFFAPPAQKKKKNKKGRPHPHNFPANAADHQEETQDMKRTMEAVHRDLFEDDASEEEDEDEEQQAALGPADRRSRRSAHERRKAELAEEIRKLETANAAKREWTLSGEARAADRPMNSLLEQDLDFERAGKPVPVSTAEVSESIEELIKRRILAMDFQDIPRRRPDDLATGKEGRRGAQNFELDDSKSKKGLAEEYEEEHLKRTDPNFVDVKDEKLAKEQKDIEALWREVSGQLDSLSSWHFRPKQAAPQLDIRVDAPAVVMEDARPSAGGDVAGASQLAPQEVYKAGDATGKGSNTEVVGKSGLPAGCEELTQDERKRRRRREKERIRKAGGIVGDKNESRAKKDKKAMLGDLKRGGVKVIGKKGEVQDVDGKGSKKEGGGQGAAKFML